MNERRKTLIILERDVEELINEKPDGLSNRITILLRRYRDLRTYAANELRGKFTPAEWMYIVDALNGTIISDDSLRYSASVLATSMQEANTYENLGAKWSVDVPAMVDKILSLTHSQVDALYWRIEKFWDNAEKIDTSEWAKF